MLNVIDNEVAALVPALAPVGAGTHHNGQVFLKKSTLEKMLAEINSGVVPGTLIVKTTTKANGLYKVVRRVNADGTTVVSNSSNPLYPVGSTSGGPSDVKQALGSTGIFKAIYTPGVSENEIPVGTCWRAAQWPSTDRLRWNGASMESVLRDNEGVVTVNRTLADALESEALGYWKRVPDAPAAPTVSVGDDVILTGRNGKYRAIITSINGDGTLVGKWTIMYSTLAPVAYPRNGPSDFPGYTLVGLTSEVEPGAYDSEGRVLVKDSNPPVRLKPGTHYRKKSGQEWIDGTDRIRFMANGTWLDVLPDGNTRVTQGSTSYFATQITKGVWGEVPNTPIVKSIPIPSDLRTLIGSSVEMTYQGKHVTIIVAIVSSGTFVRAAGGKLYNLTESRATIHRVTPVTADQMLAALKAN